MKKWIKVILLAFLTVISVLYFAFSKDTANQIAPIKEGIPNSSLEQMSNDNKYPKYWNNSSWGENKADFSYLSSGYTGKRSVRTRITGYTSGDAKWHYQPQIAVPGKQYTFADHYKSDTQSRVVVEFTSKNNTKTYYELKTAPASVDWAIYRDNFTTPIDVKTMSVFHLLSSVGYLITDDYTLEDYSPKGFNRALISLTFDDGWESQFTEGDPVLRNAGFPATYYLSTGLLNTKGYMSDKMVMSLRDSGNEIANHTMSHPRLLNLSDRDVNDEFRDSQVYLSAHFGTTSYNFASPYGQTDDRVIDIARQYFKSHRGVISGYNYKDNFDIYHLKVQNILVTTTEAEVQSWLSKAEKDNSWLILVYHAVDEEGDKYKVSPANFQKQMNLIKQSEIKVVTVEQALSEIKSQLTN